MDENELDKTIKECEKYNLKYHVVVNGIFIRTKALAGWFILNKEEESVLYHENYRWKKVRQLSSTLEQEYHVHNNIVEKTPSGMVKYIVAHDRAMLRKGGMNK